MTSIVRDILRGLVLEKGVVDIILKHKEKFEWVDLIDRHEGDWDVICNSVRLSEDFIRDFQNEVNWKIVSTRQRLSEDFIREFKHKVNWRMIKDNQFPSDELLNDPLISKIIRMEHLVEEQTRIAGDLVVAQAAQARAQAAIARAQARQAAYVQHQAQQQAADQARAIRNYERWLLGYTNRTTHRLSCVKKATYIVPQVRFLIDAKSALKCYYNLLLLHYDHIDSYPAESTIITRQRTNNIINILSQLTHKVYGEDMQNHLTLGAIRNLIEQYINRVKNEFNVVIRPLNFFERPTEVQVRAMKLVQLKDAANSLSISFRSASRKAVILEKIISHLNDQRFV